MYKPLITLLFLGLLAQTRVAAQAYDSVFYNFHTDTAFVRLTPDTSARPLWQLGYSNKSFCSSDTIRNRGLMTDTTHPYPIHANNWFTLHFDRNWTNPQVKFWHRYNTTAGRDGCVVEFSTDTGATWLNLSYCGIDVQLFNFYAAADTLRGGLAAFSGSSGTEKFSQANLTTCIGERPTGTTSCFNIYSGTVDLRFRFVSDSIGDTLSGWKIDSMKIVYWRCGPGNVPTVPSYHSLNVFPNPTPDGNITFPELPNESEYRMEIYNSLGQKIISKPYTHELQLTSQPYGVYYYKVSNGKAYYSGSVLRE